MTLREIAYLNDAIEAREHRHDWETARIVAMLVAVNSKKGKYDPVKYMAGGRELQRQAAVAKAARPPMTGEQIIDRFRALGVPIIDKRAKPTQAV